MPATNRVASQEIDRVKKDEVLLLWRDLSAELAQADVFSVREKLDSLS